MNDDNIQTLGSSVSFSLPLIESVPQAKATGFASPSDEYMERPLSLDQYLVQNPIATFFMRANGDSMLQHKIYPGDLLLVDRSLKPVNGDIIIAVLDGELIIRKLDINENHFRLLSGNRPYQAINISNQSDLQIWGVVLYSIHRQKKNG